MHLRPWTHSPDRRHAGDRDVQPMSHSAGDNPRDLPTFSQFACSEQTMLSKVKLVCILEAANELPKQRNRVNWVHPFNVEAKGEKRFRKITKMFGILKQSFSATTECQSSLLTNC